MAYLTLGSLSPEEQAKFERAKSALAEKLGGERGETERFFGPGDDLLNFDESAPEAEPRPNAAAQERGHVRPEELRDRLSDSIGEEQLRLEQPGVSLEDKRQLLLDFSRSILGDEPRGDGEQAPGGSAADAAAGQGAHALKVGPLRVMQARWAQELSINPQVKFVGERIGSIEDLARKAQALRNPLWETFYLLPVDADGNLLEIMAISSRVPCSTKLFENGTGMADHANFLRRIGAKGYYLLHNHPTGDPTPSNRDKAGTREHAGQMRARAGWARRGLASAERAAGGRGTVQPVQLAIENCAGQRSALQFQERLAELFGKKILFVKGVGKALPFDGMVDPDHPDTIIIDADSPQGLSFLFGHEIGHSIQHQRPDLYDAFQKTLLGMAEDWSDYRERLESMTEAGRAEFAKEHPGVEVAVHPGRAEAGAGASARPGRVELHLDDLRDDLTGFARKDRAARMEGHFREERTHLLQFEAVRRTLPPGKDYETHFRETYDALHEELTPEQLAAARTAYDASSSKQRGGVGRPSESTIFLVEESWVGPDPIPSRIHRRAAFTAAVQPPWSEGWALPLPCFPVLDCRGGGFR